MTWLDWRSIVWLFAGLNLVICLPIHLTLLNRRPQPGISVPAAPSVPNGIPETAFPLAFAMFAGMLAMTGLVFNSWSLVTFRLLEGLGFASTVAVIVASSVGVYQVAGRMGEAMLAGRFSIMWTGFVSALCLPIAFMILILAEGSLAIGLCFALFYGISNGLMTIAGAGWCWRSSVRVAMANGSTASRWHRMRPAPSRRSLAASFLTGLAR